MPVLARRLRRYCQPRAALHLPPPCAPRAWWVHADRGLIALVRLADAHIDELARLVDPPLLLSPFALPTRLDLRERVRRDPPPLHAPRTERLHLGERVALRVHGAGLHHRRVQ